ncbi:hypothetical protein G3I44_14530 [Halogeometricum borinquense]|uniref:SF3 helicase domain-containing protein n=1 Tax=Halogeometricum borinquense TaxID=60847 RepID=A0A6C0ULD6_9EURY|nr:phage/plasmid primase, P4 family [Halogeometricum borinquense]QIB75403.1 hypothetical protein G3I44_14530 [Halogeometricum borinquense]
MKDKPDSPLNPENIPETLKNERQWICWRYEWSDDREKWTKIPVNPKTGGNASSTNKDTWTSFEAALAAHRNDDSIESDGIGFIFHEDDLYAGIDLDDCRNPETDETADWAIDIMETLDSFTEYSPSGTGLHVIVRGVIPDGGNRKDDVEMYDRARFFTVTGDRVPDTEPDVQNRPAQLKDVHKEYVADDEDEIPNRTPTPTEELDLEDEELIDKARNAENGDKFEELWNGNIAGYGNDHSRADQAMCNMLAFWTQCDEQWMDDLFRQSGLCRDKWVKRADYRNRTIDNAVSNCSDVYDPGENHRTEEIDEKEEPEGTAEMLDADPYKFFKTFNDRQPEFQPTKLRDYILKHQEFLPVWEQDSYIGLYLYRNGYYQPIGEKKISQWTDKILGHLMRNSHVQEVVKTVKRQPGIEITQMGGPAHLINLENGLLDIKTKDLQAHTPRLYFDTQLPVEYDPDAECPEFKAFIDEIVYDEDLPVIQEMFGYALLNDVRFEKAFMLVGSGANGKSTLLNVLSAVLGERNCANESLQDIVNTRWSVAQMHGAMANIAADIPSENLQDSSIFKALVSGDRVPAEKKGQDKYEFRNKAKMIFSANELPETPDNTDAFFRRWVLINFPNEFRDDPDPDDQHQKQKDPELEDRLLQDDELSGVLNWALEGLDRLLDQGHFSGNKSKEDVRELWMKSANSIQSFAAEFLVKAPETDEDGRAKHYLGKREVYERYQQYCEDERLEEKDYVQHFCKKIPSSIPAAQPARRRVNGSRTRVWEFIRWNPESSKALAEQIIDAVRDRYGGTNYWGKAAKMAAQRINREDIDDADRPRIVERLANRFNVSEAEFRKEMLANIEVEQETGSSDDTTEQEDDVETDKQNADEEASSPTSETHDEEDDSVPHGKTKVQFTKSVSEFMGTDLNAYGPFDKGDKAVLPDKNAEVFADQGKAETLAG